MSEQTTERYCVLVNGHAVEPGCWVDGHWGQYGPDHLADRASELGWEAKHVRDHPTRLRRVSDWLESKLPSDPFCKVCRAHVAWVDDPTVENPRQRRPVCEYRDPDHESQPTWVATSVWEQRVDATDAIETWLNEHTETDGYSWGWHDGEFYLWPTETWEEEG